MNNTISDIISAAANHGWVLEPDALQVLKLSNIDVVRFHHAKSAQEAIDFANTINYPVVAKVVSPAIMHKSEVNGVAVGVTNKEELSEHFERFRHMEDFIGMVVEEMVQATGPELIIGAKRDPQFGPVVLLGIGGTGVEIYKDTTIRMAPLVSGDVAAMVKKLRAHRLLEGYRASQPVNMDALTKLMLGFSKLVMQLDDKFESIDLNPVLCTKDRCLAADVRIVLANPAA